MKERKKIIYLLIPRFREETCFRDSIPSILDKKRAGTGEELGGGGVKSNRRDGERE